jgi:predicted TIM-barrel fold metal-dependent hydrolase
VLECAKSSADRLVPVAGFDPSGSVDQRAVASSVSAIARQGFAGIKLHPRLGGYDPLASICVTAIRAAAEAGLVVFLDTLFRQRAHATRYAADTIDQIVHECPGARIVLLHGGGSALLDVADIVRQHPALVLDLSFTLMRYAGSSLDADIRWVMGRFDQRVVIGSDMPEYTPGEAFGRAESLAQGLAEDKWANIAFRNLASLFAASA